MQIFQQLTFFYIDPSSKYLEEVSRSGSTAPFRGLVTKIIKLGSMDC
jgi:hypothetical protein